MFGAGRCRRRPRTGTLIAAASTCLVSAATAQTNDSPRDEAGRNDKLEWFSLDRLDAFFELQAEYYHTRVERDRRDGVLRSQRAQANEEWGFQERVGFDFAGTILDPSFIRFGGYVSFGLEQDRFEERLDGVLFDRTDSDRGHSLRYDLRMDFFTGKPISGSVYGRRTEQRINRRFQPTLREIQNGFGTSWFLNHSVVPMEVHYDYLETDRTGNARQRDDEHFSDSRLRYRADWNIADGHTLAFDYEHAETEQSFAGARRSFETTRDLFKLDHELLFGPQQQHSLQTIVHWQEESGDLARDFFRIGPRLELQHDENLTTRYSYQFDRERYEALDVATHRADFQLVHQLYSNLTTTVDVFGLYEEIDRDIDTTQYGASVDWQYNRSNRWGHLYANLAVAYDTQDSDGDDGVRLVIDETVTFRDPVPVTLRNRNIIPASISVTDATNTRVFRPGIDYFVVRRGNAIQLHRVRAGLIADGDTVLVDYRYQTPTDSKLDSVRVDFSIEQQFDTGWRPYYRLSYRNQEDELSTGSFLRRADRTNHHRFGVEYRRDKYTLGAEFEIFDDTVDPYDAFHFNGRWNVIRDARHDLNVNGQLSRLFFEGGVDRRNVTMLDLGVDHRWRLADGLSTVERVYYRLEDDSIDGVTHNWDVQAGLEYVVGALSCQLTLEYDRLELPASEEDNYGVYFTMRRNFPDVLARR